jgi:hypothetical protein
MKVAVPHFYVHLSMYHKSSQASQGFLFKFECKLSTATDRRKVAFKIVHQVAIICQLSICHSSLVSTSNGSGNK